VSQLDAFENLQAWRSSMDLVLRIYALTDRFPRSELYGLSGQLRRAGVSIPANIAEGNSRLSTAAYLNHVQIALGSLGELRTLVEIAVRLQYVQAEERLTVERQLHEVGRLLYGLRTALKNRLDRHQKAP